VVGKSRFKFLDPKNPILTIFHLKTYKKNTIEALKTHLEELGLKCKINPILKNFSSLDLLFQE
jgi:hypothetical protein